jgi:hypothetical protein
MREGMYWSIGVDRMEGDIVARAVAGVADIGMHRDRCRMGVAAVAGSSVDSNVL